MSSTPIIPPVGLPAAFAYDAANPTYHLEWLAWLQMRNLQAMAVAGLVWTDGQISSSAQSALATVWAAQTGAIALQSDELTALKTTLSQQEAAWVDTLLAENSALYGLPCTAENLRIRRALLDQHLQTLHYLRGVRIKPGATPLAIAIPQAEGAALRVQPWQGENESFAVSFDASAENPLWIQAVQALPEEFPAALWEAQNDLITEQSDYCEMVAELLERKRKSLPEDDKLYEEIIKELLQKGAEAGAYYLVMKYTGMQKVAAFAGMLASATVGWAISRLKHLYDQAMQNARKISAENAELLKLTRSRENYVLRRETLELHEVQMGNMLTHVIALEGQANPGQVTGGDLKANELVEALKDLQYNDEVIYLDKHTRRVNLRGKIREELPL